MIDPSNPHSPTPEFKEFLARDLARSIRHDARFAPSSRAVFVRRLGVVIISSAGTVFALALGLALGNSTGYASARVESAQRRNALASHAMDITSQVAALRVSLARTRDGLSRLAATSTSKRALHDAESELVAMEASAARIETDLTQGETAVAPLPVNIPMTRAFSIACTALAMNTSATSSQPGVAIVDLPAPTAKTSTTFGAILGVREVPGSRVLVNDGMRRQLKLLDSTLGAATTVFDTVPGNSSFYGTRALPLLRYLGDSSLSADVDAGVLLMLGPTGQITRAVSSPFAQSVPPYANLTTSLRDRYSGVDDRGRILFEGPRELLRPGVTIAERVAALGKDSMAIMRADLESRRVDTVGFVKTGGNTVLLGRIGNGPLRFSRMPVETIDVWGVLSDGTVGIVRGQDYHIDWILPDGSRRSTTKLPFDWKRMTDDEKQRLIDSVGAAAKAGPGLALAPLAPRPDASGGSGIPGARVQVPRDQRPVGRSVPMEYVPPALKDMPDYYPSVRIGAAIADLDGNLWILPNSSAQSKNGELVYDVANPKGDFHRVRLPIGRSIIGFGKGGVVYLVSGDRTAGFVLERTRLPHVAQPQLTPVKQPAIPVITLGAPSVKSTAIVGSVVGIHELSDGKVMVNDAGHRQLKVFAATLTTMTVVADSTAGNANSYGPAPVALIRFRGDSSLFPDLSTQGLLVLDGAGQVARAIALPNVRDFPNFVVGFSGIDLKGRLVYRGSNLVGPPMAGGVPTPVGDSAPILRVDLEQRRIDTIGRIRVRDGGSQVADRSDPAVVKITQTINPVPVLDEWSLLADGSVALVRGHDYHIDWVRMDGTSSSSPKMPFDWRRLTDDDKQKLIDSAKAVRAAAAARMASRGNGGGGGGVSGARRVELGTASPGRSGGGGSDSGPRVPQQVQLAYSALKDITDFYPPLRRGATVPDLDGNLWILPTTSSQSQNGELVYDVVNAKGELFERVRLPVGRSLAGFGKNGTVYLLAAVEPPAGGSTAPAFYIERARLPGSH